MIFSLDAKGGDPFLGCSIIDREMGGQERKTRIFRGLWNFGENASGHAKNVSKGFFSAKVFFKMAE